jgi:hypothetical protein
MMLFSLMSSPLIPLPRGKDSSRYFIGANQGDVLPQKQFQEVFINTPIFATK